MLVLVAAVWIILHKDRLDECFDGWTVYLTLEDRRKNVFSDLHSEGRTSLFFYYVGRQACLSAQATGLTPYPAGETEEVLAMVVMPGICLPRELSDHETNCICVFPSSFTSIGNRSESTQAMGLGGGAGQNSSGNAACWSRTVL